MGNLKRRNHLEYLGIDGRIILKWILNVTRRINLAEDMGQVMGSCGHFNEPLGLVKCREFFDQLRSCYILKENPVPWSWLVGWSISW